MAHCNVPSYVHRAMTCTVTTLPTSDCLRPLCILHGWDRCVENHTSPDTRLESGSVMHITVYELVCTYYVNNR